MTLDEIKFCLARETAIKRSDIEWLVAEIERLQYLLSKSKESPEDSI